MDMTDAMATDMDIPLGAPIPADTHAVSVSLPTWASVVGYEEGDENIISQLTIGYPRFRIHNYVNFLQEVVAKTYHNQPDTSDIAVICLPCAVVMQRFLDYIQVFYKFCSSSSFKY